MRKSLLASCCSAACFVLGLVHSHASAQGYALNILDSAERGSEWFATESLDLRGHGRMSLGVTGDWAHRPLLAAQRNGQRARALVRNQLLVQPGLSLVLWQRVRLALDVPLLLYSDGNSLSQGGVRYSAPPERVGLGDLRLGVLLRLFGEYGEWISAALAVHVALPTGKEAAYLSDGAVRVLPHLLLAGDYAGFAYAAKLGAAIRGAAHDLLGAHMGSYAYFALSLGVRMFDRRFVLGPELIGLTGLTAGDVFKRRTTPLEALLGLHYSFDNGLRLGVGIGFGLTTGLGAPEQRGLVSLEWNAPPPAATLVAAADRDLDGVSDLQDACPDQKGPSSTDPLVNGCPQTPDTDQDGVRDLDDACPEHPGQARDDPEMSGCPKPKDGDQDGVVDAYDACPDQAGEASADPQTTGCPTLQHQDAE
jgi:hypothetical protein